MILKSHSNKFDKYFTYAKKYNDSEILTYLIDNLLFKNLYLFNKYFQNFRDDQVLKLLNSNELDNPSVELINILVSNEVPSLISFNKIIKKNESLLIQPILLKRIIYLYSENKINRDLFKNLITKVNWTEISSLLIIEFLKTKPASRKRALKMLSLTFNKYLDKVKSDEKIKDNFEKLSTIKSLIKKCNGRKYYHINLWEKNGFKRYYTNKNNIGINDPENIFCEGRFWKKDKLWDSKTNKPFNVNKYWCRGDVCNELNNEVNSNLPFYKWTLLEINEIFNLKIDDLIFSIIGGWANRMNEIIGRLKCRECGSILYPQPFDPKKLGYYSVPYFECLNKNCKQYKVGIRLTHCLNKNCYGPNNNIIDSRDCPQCNNNWLVCQDCHACCYEHHDQEKLSCPNCGKIMDKIAEGFRCRNCGNVINDENKIANIRKFWKKNLNYQDKIVKK